MNPLGPSLQKVFPYERAAWPDQVERVCQALEAQWPRNPIDGAIILKGARAEHRQLSDRKVLLKARTKTRLRRFTLNNYFSCVAASGVIGPRYVGEIGAGGSMSLRGDNMYSLMIFLPPNQAPATYETIDRTVCAILGLDYDRPNPAINTDA